MHRRASTRFLVRLQYSCVPGRQNSEFPRTTNTNARLTAGSAVTAARSVYHERWRAYVCKSQKTAPSLTQCTQDPTRSRNSSATHGVLTLAAQTTLLFQRAQALHSAHLQHEHIRSTQGPSASGQPLSGQSSSTAANGSIWHMWVFMPKDTRLFGTFGPSGQRARDFLAPLGLQATLGSSGQRVRDLFAHLGLQAKGYETWHIWVFTLLDWSQK